MRPCPRSATGLALSCWHTLASPFAQVVTPSYPVLGRSAGRPVASHQEHALAGGLSVEQAIGLIRLIELPLVREQAVDIDFAFDAELGTFGLALPRKRPRR